MTNDIDRLHAPLHQAQDAVAAGQYDLDDINARILDACERQAPWREMAGLYRSEAELLQRQVLLTGAVAEFARELADSEDDS